LYYVAFALLAVLFVSVPKVAAETSKSMNYQAADTHFGTASLNGSCSKQYCASVSIGDMTSDAGGSSSASFKSIASDRPQLDVIIDRGVSSLGNLTAEKTATKTMTVRIRNYLSGGYTLQVVGEPPRFGNHTLDTPTTPTASVPGTEQFAINATSNTTPGVGAKPIQMLPEHMDTGTVTDGYNVPNRFKYVSGDTIAASRTESSRTDYTISMIVNISNATPPGHYSGDFSAIVVPAF